jgi:hypothetical protein
MTTPVDRDEDALDERYRRASAGTPATPSAATRAAILAEARRIADQQRRATEPARFDTGRPVANDRHWTLAIVGTLVAAAIAGLLVVPIYRESPVVPAEAPAATDVPARSEAARRLAAVPVTPAAAPPAEPPRQPSQAPSTAPEAAAVAAPRPALAPRVAPDATERSAAARDEARPALEGLNSDAARPLGPPAVASSNLAAGAAPARAAGGVVQQTAVAAKAAAPDTAAALREAVLDGDATRVVRLVADGASLATTGADGRTPLLLATVAGRIEVVRVLLAHGADPNAPGRDGRTPLAEARARHLDEIASILERAGAR